MRETLKKALEQFEKEGFSEEDLNRIKASYKSSYYGILETVGSKASVLTSYEMLTNGKMSLDKDIERYANVTKEDVMRVYNTYIKNKNFACVHIVPDPALQSDPNAKIKGYESINPYANENPDKSAYANLTYTPTVDPVGFDRSKKPSVTEAKPAVVPTYFTSKLDNGIKIIGTKSTETPKVYISINIKGAHLFETGKIKNGTAAFLASMMSEGTTTKSALQIENRLKELGSSINFSAGDQSFNIFVECYSDSIKPTMALLEDMFYNPSFNEKEFKLIKKAILGSIKNNNFEPSNQGQKIFREYMYGVDNPIGNSSLTEWSVANKITIEDAKNFKNNYLSPNLTTISIVGNIEQQAAISSLDFLKRWENKNLVAPVFTNFPEQQKTQIYLINKDGAKQTDLIMGYRSLPYDISGDYFKATVMNFVLGGAFNSRLNLDLREDKGWTYGIRSGFRSAGKDVPSVFVISAGVKTSATDSSITQVFKIVQNYIDNGITDEELDFTKRSLLGSDALQYESPFSKLGFLSQILNYELDNNFTSKRAEIIKSLTKEDINAMAKKYLSLDNMVIICVGDDVMIMDKLKELGLGKVKVLKMPK
jgi:zinc protease